MELVSTGSILHLEAIATFNDQVRKLKQRMDGGKRTCPRSHSWQAVAPGAKPASVNESSGWQAFRQGPLVTTSASAGLIASATTTRPCCGSAKAARDNSEMKRPTHTPPELHL